MKQLVLIFFHQVPLSQSTSLTESIVGAMERVSSSLATRCAQVPNVSP